MSQGYWIVGWMGDDAARREAVRDCVQAGLLTPQQGDTLHARIDEHERMADGASTMLRWVKKPDEIAETP